MRINIFCDLHNEFYRNRLVLAPEIGETGADLSVLDGDMDVDWKEFIGRSRRVNDSRDPSFYACGNHEFYTWCHKELLAAMRRATRGGRVQVLENDSVEIDGVRFPGARFCTNFHDLGIRHEPECMRVVGTGLNDFQVIRYHRADGTHVALRPARYRLVARKFEHGAVAAAIEGVCRADDRRDASWPVHTRSRLQPAWRAAVDKRCVLVTSRDVNPAGPNVVVGAWPYALKSVL